MSDFGKENFAAMVNKINHQYALKSYMMMNQNPLFRSAAAKTATLVILELKVHMSHMIRMRVLKKIQPVKRNRILILNLKTRLRAEKRFRIFFPNLTMKVRKPKNFQTPKILRMLKNMNRRKPDNCMPGAESTRK